MAEIDATRACVVCGVLFPRDGKREICSASCRAKRIRSYRGAPYVPSCAWCSQQFSAKTSAKYCCSEHAALARAQKDKERKAKPDYRAKASWRNREYRRTHKVGPLTGDQRKLKAERTRKRRDEYGRESREAEYASAKARRLAAIAPALLWIDASYYLAHTEALAINADIDRAARASLKAERDKQDALRVEQAKKRGLAASTLRLKENPERYAAELGRWRAKKLKRKHGILMLADGTATASVVLGGTRCLYCDCKLHDKNRSHDHMQPVARGGVHSAANIAPCCLDCNSLKGSKGFEQWVATLAPKDSRRAVAYFEKRNGPLAQLGLVFASAA